MYEADFGKLIGTLLNYVGAKNYSLASVLGYDVSYISKIINAKIFPSHKNANVMCQKIALFIAEEANSGTKLSIEKFLSLDLDHDLEKIEATQQFAESLGNKLYEAYLASTQRRTSLSPSKENYEDAKSKANSYTLINPQLRRKFLEIPLSEDSSNDRSLDLIILANVFELSRDDKLHLAGIKLDMDKDINSDFSSFKLILSINGNNEIDYMFDSVLLMYIASNYDSEAFEMYTLKFPFHSFAFAAKNHFSHFGILGKDGKCLIATTSYDEKVIQDTYETLDELIFTSSHRLFTKYTSKQMIADGHYMRTIMGNDIRLLCGVIDEFFLPPSLFQELACKYAEDNHVIKKFLDNTGSALSITVASSEISVLVYEQTLENYMLSGKIHFLNQTFHLSLEQRKKHISYIIDLLENHSNIRFKLIKSYFVEEFEQYSHPGLILSNMSSYLRINSDRAENTFLKIKDSKISYMYDKFYHNAWEKQTDMTSIMVSTIISCLFVFSDKLPTQSK